MKKIIWILILICILYILLVFKAPGLTTEIEKQFGFEWLTETLTWVKGKLDEASTKIPSQEELESKYNKWLSWAIDIKNTVVDGIDKTKETIDNVRVTLSWAQDTVSDTLDFVDNATQKVKDAKEAVDQVNQSVQDAKTALESINGEPVE